MSRGEYRVTLNVSEYIPVGDDYQQVTVGKIMKFRFWDEVQSLLGAIVEGSSGRTSFTIEFIKDEEETDE